MIFASGNGSNAQNICRYFGNNNAAKVVALFCNNPNAGVIGKMQQLEVPVVLFNKDEFNNADSFLEQLNSYNPDLIVLAGFLWLMPEYLVKQFQNRIINIHPALLPAYGGKGMYGHHVHEAVMAAKEKEHGITIHFVNEHYDEGAIIFQAKFDIDKNDNVESVSKKISALEMQYFPEAIKRLIKI